MRTGSPLTQVHWVLRNPHHLHQHQSCRLKFLQLDLHGVTYNLVVPRRRGKVSSPTMALLLLNRSWAHQALTHGTKFVRGILGNVSVCLHESSCCRLTSSLHSRSQHRTHSTFCRAHSHRTRYTESRTVWTSLAGLFASRICAPMILISTIYDS